MRVLIAPGVTIDMYNLHAEAGTQDLDYAARREGLRQLRKYIDTNSAGQPVIVFGDTNCRFNEAKDSIRLLTEGDSGLTDVWTQLRRGGVPPAAGTPSVECKFPNPKPGTPVDTACELTDKVMYRSSPRVKLVPSLFSNEKARFLTPSGGPLSDHYPISVSFAWELNPTREKH